MRLTHNEFNSKTRASIPVMSTPPHGDDAATLADAFAGVARRLRRSYGEAMEPLGLTPHHARALRVIQAHGPLRLGGLADWLRVAPRSVTDVVDSLEEQGYVAREPDPGDRRAVVVAVTGAGRRRLLAVERARRAQAERFFEALDEADRAQLARLLEALHSPPCA